MKIKSKLVILFVGIGGIVILTSLFVTLLFQNLLNIQPSMFPVSVGIISSIISVSLYGLYRKMPKKVKKTRLGAK